MVSQQAFVAKNGLIVNTNLLTANASTGRIGANTASPNVSFQIAANDAIAIPAGNTGTRPATGAGGYFRYNTDTNNFEGYANGAWGAVGGGISLVGANGDLFYNNTSGLGASVNLVFTSGTTLSTVNVNANVFVGNIVQTVNVIANNINASVITSSNNSIFIQANATEGGIFLDASGDVKIQSNNTFNPFILDANGGVRFSNYRYQTDAVANGTVTFDCANGNIAVYELNGATTITAANLPQQGGFYAIAVFGNNQTLAWSNNFWWPSGVVPTQTADAWDVYTFVAFLGVLMGVQAPNMQQG